MKRMICILVIAVHLSACATYENRSISFRPPQDYSNSQDTSGLMVGAEAFANQKLAEEIFGFDIRAAGVLPVQVAIDNKSGEWVEVVAGQTFLIDASNRYWKVLTNRDAAERVEKATQTGAIGKGAGKGAALGAAAGALLGLAIGIVSGRGVGSAVLKGGVLGGAGGAVIGGADKAGDNREQEYKIADDVREKGIEGKVMPSEALASGFIYFPGEAETAKELRLQVRFRNTGRLQTLNLKFK
ncbi:MAG: hypothetical protein WC156_01620 [Pedobacter sp.]